MSPLIAGHATAWGVVMHDVIVSRGAFSKLLAAGNFQPKMLLGHEGEEIGRWLEFREDDVGLLAIGRLDLDAKRGRLAFEMTEDGRATGLSLGAPIVGLARPITPEVRHCREVFSLPEISVCEVPANPAARLLHFTAGVA
ncbi:HK97 family phage prohead protease [Mesorhizobium sp. M4B.F.Ca.ET.214.01.1.1]|uniref:HK97 family phage prohead protease n=1 Tax=Mesorhizobium sp. M4B.F.Ca.ET.214.01.1.1 TaxID=2563955 RepID=UPI001093DEC8|nr:HK97 family phage prohead protease [Mesorhizobium sp. M4B.F.Ca.ET.214.01.1.1]TGQ35340.1 HK97 family phage prohead protease [Mesorhizobium sp. M4B.F.Ca.ET.214.01.1.1]